MNTKRKMIEMLIGIFILIAIFVFASLKTAFGADYYWVGGPGNWSDLTHWSNTSGGVGSAHVQVPQTTDNVFIDANSGLTSGQYITLNANVFCYDLNITPGASSNIGLFGNKPIKIYGEVTLDPGLRAGPLGVGAISFFTPVVDAGATKDLVFNENTLTNSLVDFEDPDAVARYEVYGWRHKGDGGTTLTCDQASDTITFHGGGYFAQEFYVRGGGAVIVDGDVTGFVQRGTTTYPIYGPRSIRVYAGYLQVTGSAYGETFQHISGSLCKSKLEGNDNRFRLIMANVTDGNVDVLDISGATISLTGGTTAGFMKLFSSTKGTLIADGSTINFGVPGTNGDGGLVTFGAGNVFHNINGIRTFSLSTSGNSGVQVDSLICVGITSGISTDVIYIGDGVSAGYMEWNSAKYTVKNKFYIRNNAQFNIVGNCSATGGYVDMYNSLHEFETGSSITGDRARLSSCTAVGPATPYNPGPTSFSPNGVHTGWSVGSPTPRYLRWVGPVPSDITNENTYATWNDPANWTNGSTFPGAKVGDAGGECPPTIYDSIRFPDSSYVIISKSLAMTKSMIWEGEGVLADRNYASYNNRKLEIYGMLEFSPEMILTSRADVYFRAFESWPTLKVNGKNFPSRVIFAATDDNGKWTMLDDFSVNNVLSVLGSAYRNIYLSRGHLDTDGNTVYVRRFYSGGGYSSYRVLELNDSEVIVSDNSSYAWNANHQNDNLTILAGTSHIIFDASSTTNKRPTMIPGGNQTYYNVTFKANQPKLGTASDGASMTTWFNIVTFERSAFIDVQSSGRIVNFNTLDIGTVNSGLSVGSVIQAGSTNGQMVVDTARFRTNTSFMIQGTYNNVMKLYPIKSYNFSSNTYLQTISPGGVLESIGTCVKNINISNGQFISPDPQSVSYTNITNNTVLSSNFTYSDALASGTTTGWTGVSGVPRTLYWYDGNPGASLGKWDDLLHWSLMPGILDPATGNCPPKLIDTVVFVNASFTGDDTVDVDQIVSATCADMRWETTSGNPKFYTSFGQYMDVYGSLTFSTFMDQAYDGPIRFLGTDDRNITSNGQTYIHKVVFSNSGITTLNDDFTIDLYKHAAYNGNYANYMIWHINGGLDANDNNINTLSYYSSGGTSNHPRSLDISNSQMTISGSGDYSDFKVTSLGSFDLLATNSEILFTSISTGNRGVEVDVGGLTFNDITFENGGGRIYSMSGSSFNNVYFKQGGSVGLSSVGYGNYTINRIDADGNLTTYNDHEVNRIVVKENGSFYGNLTINDTISFTADVDNTYQLGASKTLYLKNEHTELEGIGNGSDVITFNSTIAGTRAWVRKDTGQVCVDYFYMRDIHAVGNGLITSDGVNTIPGDTLLNDSYLPNKITSGRARFFAGSNANDQGNNAGWDFSPYPPIPTIDIPTLDKDVCSNESLTITFEFEGVLPAYLTYDSTVNGLTSFRLDTVLTTPGFGFGSEDLTGSGTTADPYVWTYTTTMPPYDDTLEIVAVDVVFDRCFIGDANVSGDVKFTRICWDPLPVELLHFYAVKDENTSSLRWETASETNNAYFDVQRSTDGVNFHSIGKVEGAGNSTQNIAYSFVDESPVTGKNYYRLQQVDFNGDSEISQTEVVNFDELISFSIYPNPTKGNLTISHNISKANIIIYDLSGKVVYTQSNIGEQQTLNVNGLSSGSYLVEITNETTHEKNYKKLEILE